MPAISVTAASVVAVSDATIVRDFNFGATVTAGQAVYLDVAVTPNVWKLADADSTALTAAATGIALNGGASGQPAAVQKAGVINIGGTVVVGTWYVVDGTPGGICPTSDLATNDWSTLVGVGVTATNINLQFKASGVQVPA
jgi:hypothetical protein